MFFAKLFHLIVLQFDLLGEQVTTLQIWYIENTMKPPVVV